MFDHMDVLNIKRCAFGSTTSEIHIIHERRCSEQINLIYWFTMDEWLPLSMDMINIFPSWMNVHMLDGCRLSIDE
jgi:hypothetical protein